MPFHNDLAFRVPYLATTGILPPSCRPLRRLRRNLQHIPRQGDGPHQPFRPSRSLGHTLCRAPIGHVQIVPAEMFPAAEVSREFDSATSSRIFSSGSSELGSARSRDERARSALLQSARRSTAGPHRPKSQINRRIPGRSPPSRSRPGLSAGSTVRQTPAALHHDGDENLKDYIAAEEQETDTDK